MPRILPTLLEVCTVCACVYRCAYPFGPVCRCACVVMDNKECGRQNRYFFALSLRKSEVTILGVCAIHGVR